MSFVVIIITYLKSGFQVLLLRIFLLGEVKLQILKLTMRLLYTGDTHEFYKVSVSIAVCIF